MGQCAHLRNYTLLPDCEVVAIAEIIPSLGEKVARHYGVPRVYNSHEALFANEELDGVVASQPFTRHGILVPELLKAGVPIFSEKPLCANIAIGEKLVSDVKASGTWHMVGYHKRHDPATIWAKTRIDELKHSDELGKMRYIRITMPVGDWIAGGFAERITVDGAFPELDRDPAPEDMDSTTFDAYVTFVNYYIHQINLLRHLFGEDYTVTHADRAGLIMVAESTGGLTGVIEMNPYSTTVDWQEKALVAFEKGYIELDLPAPLARNRPGRVRCYVDPGNGTPPHLTEPTLPWDHAMLNQARNFVDSIHGKSRPRCEAAEALDDLKIARDYINLLKANQSG